MKLFCIMGDERAFLAKSPSIFRTVLERVGIKGAYVPLRVEPSELGKALDSLRVLHFDGANITVPFKESAVTYCDVLSEGANIIGAVNTIVRNGQELKGYNTNAIGFMDALNGIGYELDGKQALVVGTGGAAKAVLFILNWLRSDIVRVAGRNPAKADRLVERFGGATTSFEALSAEVVPAHILINATSVSSPDESAAMAALVDSLELSGCELVVDLNYGRRESIWEKWAGKRNVRFMNGLPILAHQTRRTFALWTGMQVPADEFLKALNGK